MIFRFILHLVFISVFLVGSTISCTAFANIVVGHSHHAENISREISPECCPKDGHKKQIGIKSTLQIVQKQGFDIVPCIPQDDHKIHGDESIILPISSYYRDPLYDRHRLFFIETIRLLL